MNFQQILFQVFTMVRNPHRKSTFASVPSHASDAFFEHLHDSHVFFREIPSGNQTQMFHGAGIFTYICPKMTQM